MALNESVLVMREKIIQFCKNYERIIIPIIKFVVVIYALLQININIGYTEILTQFYVMFGIALISMAIPRNWLIPILMMIITVHLVSFNLILGAVTAVACLALYILFIRLYPKESLLILATMIAMKLGVAYIIPLAAPLLVGMIGIIPIMIGVIMYEMGIQITIMTQNNMIVGEVQEVLMMLLGFIQNNILLNPRTLTTLGIFVIVFIVAAIIRRQNIDYAGYVAIGIAAVVNILGFGMMGLVLEIELSVLIMVIMTILSAVIAVIIQFFSCVVDYTRAETVQFEDEDHIYYVKVVPKIKINKNQTRIEQIYTNTSKEDLDYLSNDIY